MFTGRSARHEYDHADTAARTSSAGRAQAGWSVLMTERARRPVDWATWSQNWGQVAGGLRSVATLMVPPDNTVLSIDSQQSRQTDCLSLRSYGRQSAGGSSPARPSTDSRIRS